MVRKNDIEAPIDLSDVVLGGKTDKLNLRHGFQAGATVANLTPGVFGSVAGIGLDTISDEMRVGEEEDFLRKKLHIRNLEKESRLLKDALQTKRSRWKRNLPRAGTAAASGGMGMWVGSAIGTLVPIPGATLIGGLAGGAAAGYVGDSLFNKVYPSCDQCLDNQVIKLLNTQQQGQEVTSEDVFTALAAGLRYRDRKKIEKDLKAMTGSPLLENAPPEVLTKLMHKYDHLVRHDTGMQPDTNLHVTASEQYAYLINNGLDASLLFSRDGRLPYQAPHIRYNQMQQDHASLPQPVTPGMLPMSKGFKGKTT